MEQKLSRSSTTVKELIFNGIEPFHVIPNSDSGRLALEQKLSRSSSQSARRERVFEPG